MNSTQEEGSRAAPTGAELHASTSSESVVSPEPYSIRRIPDCVPCVLTSADQQAYWFGEKPQRLVRQWKLDRKGSEGAKQQPPEQMILEYLQERKRRHERISREFWYAIDVQSSTRHGSRSLDPEQSLQQRIEHYFAPGLTGHVFKILHQHKVDRTSLPEGQVRPPEGALPSWLCDPALQKSLAIVRELATMAGWAWETLCAASAGARTSSTDHFDYWSAAALSLWIMSGLLDHDPLVRVALRQAPELRSHYEWPKEDPTPWIEESTTPPDNVDLVCIIAARHVHTTVIPYSQPFNQVFSPQHEEQKQGAILRLWRILEQVGRACTATVSQTSAPLAASIVSSRGRRILQNLQTLREYANPYKEIIGRARPLTTYIETQLRAWSQRLSTHRSAADEDLDDFLKWSTWIEQKIKYLIDTFERYREDRRTLQRQAESYHPEMILQASTRVNEEHLAIEKTIQECQEEIEHWAQRLAPVAGGLEVADASTASTTEHPPTDGELDQSSLGSGNDEVETLRRQLEAEKDRNQEAGKQIENYRQRLEELRNASAQKFVPRNEILARIPSDLTLTPLMALTIAATHRPLLRILDSAWSSADRASRFRYGRRLLDNLLRLGGEYALALRSGQSDALARTVFGQDVYKARESEGVMNNSKCRSARTFVVDGREVVMERHLAIGVAPNTTETLRVYFAWHEDHIVIGHCGEHLPIPHKPS